MADPDLQMRGWGHPDPEMGGGGGGNKKNFLAKVWSKIKGGAGPSLGSATAISLETLYVDLQGA